MQDKTGKSGNKNQKKQKKFQETQKQGNKAKIMPQANRSRKIRNMMKTKVEDVEMQVHRGVAV